MSDFSVTATTFPVANNGATLTSTISPTAAVPSPNMGEEYTLLKNRRLIHKHMINNALHSTQTCFVFNLILIPRNNIDIRIRVMNQKIFRCYGTASIPMTHTSHTSIKQTETNQPHLGNPSNEQGKYAVTNPIGIEQIHTHRKDSMLTFSGTCSIGNNKHSRNNADNKYNPKAVIRKRTIILARKLIVMSSSVVNLTVTSYRNWNDIDRHRHTRQDIRQREKELFNLGNESQYQHNRNGNRSGVYD